MKVAVAGAGASPTGATPVATVTDIPAQLALSPAQMALRTAAAHPDENNTQVDERAARASAIGGRAGRGEEGRRRGRGS